MLPGRATADWLQGKSRAVSRARENEEMPSLISSLLSGGSRRTLMLGTAAIAVACTPATPALAVPCKAAGEAPFGGAPAPLAVDADCIDPDYNANTLVIDGTEAKTLKLPDGRSIAYTEVKAHFPAAEKGNPSAPPGVHRIIWRFPEKTYFRNRFFQQTYPLNIDMLNTVDARFAFETAGGYTVGISPGNPNLGFRVPAAAAKLAKDYARKFYGTDARIYGYLFGQSGGSVQTIAAAEGTTGVWDGLVPIVIATDGLNNHSFDWGALYNLAIPEVKRKAIADAVAPGSDKDIYEGLDPEERAVLNEVLSAGFPRHVLETMQFSVGAAMLGMGSLRTFDPDYFTDFWTKPGYEGSNPPAFLKAAIVDGVATISAITRNGQGVPTVIVFDPASMPALGSIGSDGVQFTVQKDAGESAPIRGKLEGTTFKLDDGKNDPALLAKLAAGTKVKLDNRTVLALAFYPRHSVLDNGNPAYNQYRNGDGSPKYVQRAKTPIPIPLLSNIGAAGGIVQSGRLKAKTIVFENLSDGNSYPYVASYYAGQVKRALGAKKAEQMLRLYYQQNGFHGTFLDPLPGKFGTMTAATGGTLHQVLLDLADWAEKGIAPRPSTRYAVDRMNQVVVPASSFARGGHQPSTELTVNGGKRAEVGVNQPVTLTGRIEMPPGSGQVVQYDWYLGTPDFKFEPAVKLATPKPKMLVSQTVSFEKPGEYMITLRATGQRDGKQDSTTPLVNIDRVRVVVR
jgi:hypothetical protein